MITPTDLAAAETAALELEESRALLPAQAAQVFGVRLEATDPRKIALWQAINWLDMGAPGRAREILLELVRAL